MYIAQTTKDRIKTLCKTRKISMEDMLSKCSLGVNAIRQINDTKGMSSFSLAKIADYLNCSVDYLLGRTDIEQLPTISNKVMWLIYKSFAKSNIKDKFIDIDNLFLPTLKRYKKHVIKDENFSKLEEIYDFATKTDNIIIDKDKYFSLFKKGKYNGEIFWTLNEKDYKTFFTVYEAYIDYLANMIINSESENEN